MSLWAKKINLTKIGEKMDKIAEKIVKKIKNLPNGTKFTIGELLAQEGVDFKDTEKMFEYNKLIYSQISSLVKTPDEYTSAIVGLPFNIPWEICK